MLVPVLVRVRGEDGSLVELRLGHPLVDAVLAHIRARGRLNSWLAAAFDLKVFFTAIEREPADVTTADVFSFIQLQRRPRVDGVVRIADGEAGLSVHTIRRRLATLASFYRFALIHPGSGVTRNPVPRAEGLGRGGSRRRRNGDACSVRHVDYQSFLNPTRSPCFSLRCARRETGRWFSRCCMPVSAAARSWGCAPPMCGSVNANCLSSRERAAINAS